MKTMSDYPRFYQRNLPHWQPEGVTFAITFCLKGALPPIAMEKLKSEKDGRMRALSKQINSMASPEMLFKLKQEELRILDMYERDLHQLLDNQTHGPSWLADPPIAQIMWDSFHYAEREMNAWRLHAFCIMPNHVHLIVDQVQPVLHKVLFSVKRFTSRKANQKLGLTGQPFWQAESYDHIIRSPQEFRYQVKYILDNPMKGGLVEAPCDWEFTYLRKGSSAL